MRLEIMQKGEISAPENYDSAEAFCSKQNLGEITFFNPINLMHGPSLVKQSTVEMIAPQDR